MAESTNWTCPTCGEQHEVRFDICWKCGSDSTGERHPAFQITEPVCEDHQAPEKCSEASEPPTFQLPTTTYFSIPLFVLFSLTLTREDMSTVTAGEFPTPSRRGILLFIAGMVLIGIPMFCVMVQDMFYTILRRKRPEESLMNTFNLVSMFRLPKSFCEAYRWFVPIYYGSLVAALIIPVGVQAYEFCWNFLYSG